MCPTSGSEGTPSTASTPSPSTMNYPSSDSLHVDCSVSGLLSVDAVSKALVLDFGSQYSHLIVRRLRDLSVYSELKRCDISIDEIRKFCPGAVVLSGGPSSVYEKGAPHVCGEFWKYVEDQGVPVLGICYGMQEMVNAMGGTVECSEDRREYGHAVMRWAANHDSKDPLLADVLADTEVNRVPLSPERATCRVWMSHGDKVTSLPSGFEVVTETGSSEFAAIRCLSKRMWGLQFHPEVTHTERGTLILRNFVFRVAGMKGTWDMTRFAEKEVERLRAVVGECEHVIGAVSGGVDSTVAAALVHKAIGDRFHGFTIDTGLLRKDEGTEVVDRLRKHIPGLNISLVDASERFLTSLTGVKDPETKRKIIGAKFVEEFERAVEAMADSNGLHLNVGGTADTFLLQGTLYPDVIESVSFKGPSHSIKTHHNVGGLPAHMKLKVLEPLRELFKDEVRALGEELGIPHESVWRHPFPGPGLGIRILGEVTKERADMLREADRIFIEEIRKSGDYEKIGQAFVVLLPEAKSVGVMGDKRTYEMTAVIRAVATSDYMTADWYRIDYDVLGRVSNRIINEVKGINRVCYDVSSKPPATIEWE
eukprot:GHVQ01014200.1.p1 GENE.GHVQ01014200.1~~GHVQ01014200.1.p1  ORF type:complete len:593 (-),score=72.12 GHVQ01014200.1:361-2139(-)